jgi:hypothetical protein
MTLRAKETADISDDRSSQSRRILSLLRQCSQAVENIAEALQILLEKRSTLEEKAICAYLLEIAQLQAAVSSQLIGVLRQSNAELAESELLRLTDLNESLLENLAGFLKAAKYDFNYLEQYFEHDFYEQLEAEDYKANYQTWCDLISRKIKTQTC